MRRDDICLYLGPADRAQLEALCANRNTPRKVAWRAEIVLATADGCGTNEIMRRAETSKPTVWRWQERYLDQGVAGPRARQDPALAGAAFVPGNTPQGYHNDSPGDAAQCHAVEPFGDGRGYGDFAVECGAVRRIGNRSGGSISRRTGGSGPEAAPDARVQGLERPDVRGESHRDRRALP